MKVNFDIERAKPTCYEIMKLCIKMWSVVGVEPVNAAPIGLYTKLRKTVTFQMDVMQKLHIGKVSNLAHISTYGWSYQYCITKWVLKGLLQVKQY